MPEDPRGARFRLADLVVDTATRQVWRDGAEVTLTGLSFDLLKALMDIGTRVVTTDELMDRVWPGRVVNAETVGKRVELVREALGDNSQEPRYIALVRGRGYRLLHAPEPDTEQVVSSRTAAPPEEPASRRRRLPMVVAAVAAVAIAAVAIAFLVRAPRQASDAQTVAANEGPSVAVLPFLNLSEDAANAYFSDGMAEELLGTLSKMPGLRVASRTSAFTFRGSNQPLPEIARALNVDHIVEGSVRKAGNRIRVTAQLIDVRSDSHLWAETYDRELSDVFEIQREISERIADALKVKFAPGSPGTSPAGTRNTEAWQLYLRGNQLWQGRSEQGIRQSISLLKRAIELDPDFAEAHASLAGAYWVSFFWTGQQDSSVLDDAEAAASRAISLDPTLSQAHAVLGSCAMAHLRWNEAEMRHRYALKLNPNDAHAGYWLGETLSLAGRTREALQLLLEIERLDPISPPLLDDIGRLYERLGDMERACAYSKRVTELFTNSAYAWLRVADCHEREGNLAAATEAENKALSLLYQNAPLYRLLRRSETDPSAAREARAVIDKLTNSQQRYLARYLSRMGDQGAALEHIERDVLRHDINPLRDLWWPEGKELRAHPRFRPFVEKIGLVEYWKKAGWPDICRPAGDSFTCD